MSICQKNILGVTQPSSKDRRYALTDLIHSGSQGIVYEGYDYDQPSVMVAVKIPILELGIREGLTFVRREAYFLERLSPHQGVVSYIDHSERRQEPYLVIELVSRTLQDQFWEGKISSEDVLTYLSQIPTVLDWLNQKKVGHTDIKCSNLGYNGMQIKLLDFSLALDLPFAVQRKAQNGYPVYCPPEMKATVQTVTKSADVYCAGKALEYMLTGQYASEVEDTIDTIELFHGEGLPESFKVLMRRMLAEDHACRAHPPELIKLADRAVREITSSGYQFSKWTTAKIPADNFS